MAGCLSADGGQREARKAGARTGQSVIASHSWLPGLVHVVFSSFTVAQASMGVGSLAGLRLRGAEAGMQCGRQRHCR